MGKSEAKYPAHTIYETASVFCDVCMVNAEVDGVFNRISLDSPKFSKRIIV